MASTFDPFDPRLQPARSEPAVAKPNDVTSAMQQPLAPPPPIAETSLAARRRPTNRKAEN